MLEYAAAMNEQEVEQAKTNTAVRPCALCLKSRELRYSHIIPEFFYKHLYDANHRYWMLSTRPAQHRVIQQKGQREYLLCGNCEQQFSVYERYVKKLLTATDDIGVTYKRGDAYTVVNGIDYKPLKLFLLSVLWRSSVSTLPFFRHVRLGPIEGEVRQMLRAENPGPAPSYSCMIWSLTDKGERVPLIFPPLAIKVGRRMHYKFIFGGYVWNFCASRTTDSKEWDSFVLSATGRMVIGHRTLDDIRPELDALIVELDALKRIPAFDF